MAVSNAVTQPARHPPKHLRLLPRSPRSEKTPRGFPGALETFAIAARRCGATIVRLDCRAIEPTEAGFLRELTGAILGADSASAEDTTDRLAVLGDPVVVALDNYEVFRLMDGWLHQVFAPALPVERTAGPGGAVPTSCCSNTSRSAGTSLVL